MIKLIQLDHGQNAQKKIACFSFVRFNRDQVLPILIFNILTVRLPK